MKKNDFDTVLSKNRIARYIKEICSDIGETVPEYIMFDFDEIEKATGTVNQPTARDILNTSMDI